MKRGFSHPAEIGEATSLVISILIILGVVGYLVYDVMQPRSSLVGVTVTAGTPAAVPETGQYVLPVIVTNESNRVLPYLRLQARFATGATYPIEIEYLPVRKSRELFVYIDGEDAGAALQVSPAYYRLN